MGDLDANIEVYMAQGYDRKKAIGKLALSFFLTTRHQSYSII